MSVGPAVAALAGMRAGRAADKIGTGPTITAGLVALLSGCLLLSVLPTKLVLLGYIPAIVILTLGYAFFQTANNAAVMAGAAADQRGVVSGMLSLSRNLGLIGGASIMGAVYARSDWPLRGCSRGVRVDSAGR